MRSSKAKGLLSPNRNQLQNRSEIRIKKRKIIIKKLVNKKSNTNKKKLKDYYKEMSWKVKKKNSKANTKNWRSWRITIRKWVDRWLDWTRYWHWLRQVNIWNRRLLRFTSRPMSIDTLNKWITALYSCQTLAHFSIASWSYEAKHKDNRPLWKLSVIIIMTMNGIVLCSWTFRLAWVSVAHHTSLRTAPPRPSWREDCECSP